MVDDLRDSRENGVSVALDTVESPIERSEPSQLAIVVAGMHRSGTSAVARMLSLLGAELPRTLMQAASDNDLGFWESRTIMEVHEELFESLGIAWTDPDPIPEAWFRSALAERYEYRLVDLLRDEYGDAPLLVVKDPRICRIIPLWQKALTRARVTGRFVIPVRNPLEVAASLRERNELPTHQSLLLWLRHVLEAERDTRGSGRIFLSYEDLLRDWRPSVLRIADWLGVSWPLQGHEVEARIASFLSPNRRHQRFDLSEIEARPDVVTWVKEAYRAALSEAAGRDESPVFDHIRADLEVADLAFGSIVARARLDLRDLQRQLAKAEEHAAELETQRSVAQEMLRHRDRLIDERTAERDEQTAALAAAMASAATLEDELEATRSELVETQLADVRELRQLLPWILKPTRANLRRLKTYRTLRRSAEFDDGFYYRSYPDVARARMDPLRHYVNEGWKEGRNPNPSFDTSAYLAQRPDVAATRVNPLLHYIRYGRLEESGAAKRSSLPPAPRIPSPSRVQEGTTAVLGIPPPGLEDALRFPAVQDVEEERFGDTSAIAHLESLRSQGLAYLLVSDGSGEWLSSHPRFGRHLSSRYPGLSSAQSDVRYDVRPYDGRPRSWQAQLDEVLLEHQTRYGGEATILDWNTGLADIPLPPHLSVAVAPSSASPLPYLADSFDVVLALSSGGDIGEAHRAARNAVVSMEKAGDPLQVEWLREPDLRRPSVSIVIPSYNGSGFLRSCLRALHETLPRAYEVEVIVVDDASSDETPGVLLEWADRDGRFRSIRNETNSGFTITCNNGAHAAEGEIIVFLNNDTVPIAGWLPPLVRPLLDRPSTGAVGGKMVFPDGRLQEAGAVIFSDGGAANFGKNDPDPDAAIYNFVRDVDYCSAALLATPRRLFLELGGFDTRYAPIYYEDTDYCLQVHEAGLDVLYQPESVIIHAEGGWSGNDISKGGKRHQALNQAKFVEKWAHVLPNQPTAPSGYDEAAWERLLIRTGVREAR